MSASEDDNIPLPGELTTEEESPYLRRQKAVSVRRGRISRRLRWILWGVALLAPVGLVGYGLATFALTSSCFVLYSADDVVVTGNRFVSREEVLNALRLPLGTKPGAGVNVFRLPLEEKRRLVESIPWVQSAALTRVFPHRLVVQVTERSPVAFVNREGRVGLVDAEGMVLEKPENSAFDFPVLTGLEAAQGTDDRRARLALYTEFMTQLGEESPRSGWMISEVDLRDGDDLKALLVQGRETIEVHFGHEEFLERFRSFLALLPELRKSNEKMDSVDLRYRNQIVVNPQAPTAAPAPAEQSAPPGGEMKD